MAIDDLVYCYVCGIQFKSVGTILEQWAETEEERDKITAKVKELVSKRGGPRGICSVKCLVKRLTHTNPS